MLGAAIFVLILAIALPWAAKSYTRETENETEEERQARQEW